MRVLIDSGNTRLKVAMILDESGGDPTALSAVQIFEGLDEQALQGWLASLPRPPRLACGTNVAGLTCAHAIEAILGQYNCPVRWVTSQAQACGLVSRYRHPEQLGADRWMAMIGVRAHLAAHHPPFLLANFGTATTLDTVSAEGVFEGGLILPGPALMRHALADHTANLPLVSGATVQDFPVDTHAAITSGVAAAQAGALVRQWMMGKRRYGVAPAIYVSGGGWENIAIESQRLLTEAATFMGEVPPYLSRIEHPVLSGLAYWATHSATDLHRRPRATFERETGGSGE